MLELKIKLYCPKCQKDFSEASIFRQGIDSILNEKNHWEKKLIIVCCPQCKDYLQIITEINK